MFREDRESTMSGRGPTHVTVNDQAIAMIHTHPFGSASSLSGGAVFVNGRRKLFDGDIQVAVERGKPIYSFGGNDRGRWYFDYTGYNKSVSAGKDTNFESYERRIK
jgi:hypothetical protein